MKRWSQTVVALSLALITSRAAAVPAPPQPIELRNGDGTVVRGRLFGDERLSWVHDLDGYPLAFDRADRSWHYAALGPDGRFAPLPQRVGTVDPAALGLTRGLTPGKQAKQRALAARAPQPRPVPLLGAVRNLTLLVKFDCSAAAGGCDPANEQVSFGADQYEQVLNGATGSLKAYYLEASYGQLQLTSTVATGDWIQLPRNDEYYVWNEANRDGVPSDLVVHAVAVLNQQRFDFRQFDGNRDGVIDAIHVIHAGPGYEAGGSPACIHSHYSGLPTPITTWDGVRIDRYHVEPEYAPAGIAALVGVIAHETGHYLGLPDLYDYSGRSSGLGGWSLMSAGNWNGPRGSEGAVPAHPDAWSKARLGFVAPRLLAVTTYGVRARPVDSTAGAVKVSAGMPSGQYFLVENRRQSGFDAYLPASGLAIYHVDENRLGYCDDYECNNNNPDHYLVDLEQPDGLRQLNLGTSRGDDGDVWPFDGATAFSGATTPDTAGYGQSAGQARIALRNIAWQDNGDLRFDLEVSGTTSIQKPLGAACAGEEECLSGFCTDGLCSADLCIGVVCTTEIPCTAPGSCDPATGRCSTPTAEGDGSLCDDHDLCTALEVCEAGACGGGMEKVCPKAGACQIALGCQPQTGECAYEAAAPGTGCDDRNRCTTGDRCSASGCAGEPVECVAADDCHLAGVCDSVTGACSNPAVPDGTGCPTGQCVSGSCQPIPKKKSAFGCATGGAGPAGLLPALLVLAALRRRRDPD